MQMFRKLVVLSMLAATAAQFGMRKQNKEAAVGSLGDLDAGNAPTGQAAVDMAMKGWQEMAGSPDKMKEMMESLKDPDVVAQSLEMLNDPEYMAAAKAKLAQIQAKAQANGMLDANGAPVPGAAMGGLEGLVSQMMENKGAAGEATIGQARDWELENIARHKEGAMNDAELGMANLKNAMRDPSVMGEVAQMMKDPENMAALKKMMADPNFQAQAKRMQEQMKASGDMPDIGAMMKDPAVMQRAQQMAQMMQGGGGGGGGGAAAELARLRAENAALRQQAGF